MNRQGLFTEQGVLQRTLDEIGEDISFLAVAKAAGGAGELLEKFMEAFFDAELPDPDKPRNRMKKPANVPRRKIRAWLNNQDTAPSNPSDLNNVAENISSAYSQYTHASASTCLELYLGSPPYFHIKGLRGTHYVEPYENDLKNYLYRGLVSAGYVAIVIGAEKLYTEIVGFQDVFVDSTGVGDKSRSVTM